MQRLQTKTGNGSAMGHATERVWRKGTAWAVLLILLAGGTDAARPGFSQQQQQPQQPQAKSSFDVKARSRDVLAHLNAIIPFYRSFTGSTAPIQKVGEPNDAVYRTQAASLSLQAAQLAFQSASAQAALMAQYLGTQVQTAEPGSDQQQRMQASEANAEKQLSDLKAREAALDQQIATAKPKQLAALQAQRKQIDAAMGLASAMKDALQKIVGMSDTKGATGLTADIDRLQRTVPELTSATKTAAPELEPLNSVRSTGVSSQAMTLIDLFSARHKLDSLVKENDALHQEALELRTPISNVLRSLIGQGQQLSQKTAEPAPAASAAPVAAAAKTGGKGSAAAAKPAAAPVPDITASVAAQQSLQAITAKFKSLTAASVPLSQEIIVLEQSRANLAAWQSSVDREYKSVLHLLLLRVLGIAIALGIIFGGGEVWSHATNKYIRDIRRRRQILIVRRIVVGFLSTMVVVFGFVSQFDSLATFAGFITAGIAVGLQTILLSVAAYFFIIGRYGVKVGDRISISGVTGDVIDVGLVRFYMMELAGNGPELNPTGRVAVFSNAVLFQAGTPLYKQMPGTEFAWHEMTVKLAESADYRKISEAVVQEVDRVYGEYRKSIEAQHRSVEIWMQAPIESPSIQSRLVFHNDAVELWVRFPVQIRQASDTDEQLTQGLIRLMSENAEVKAGITATPVIQSSVRG